ncbi:N-alpha-acetyltransferase 50 [Saguinus oedipus]|uniref:N-alpha-acetyltransferase 50 n=1 Tax=Saguinus oedipus TaxID=9490 RepID=A0ABQ9VIU8_SAGOE|nr:N-alpha-acetyltransferase 50 [Saguinus oedipus]
MKGSLIELGDVTPHNIKELKRLNQVIFPVRYNVKFYKDVLEVGELAKLAYFNDIAVGASAIDFYRKFGFEIIETKNYYKRIEPADAHVLQKNLKVPSGQNADVQKTDN